MIFYCEPVDFAPGLYFAAGQARFEQEWINGTGVGRNRELAQARCRAEIAEGIALRRASPAVQNEIKRHRATGIAAASTVSDAVDRASAEAWERIAVNNWWLGRQPRMVGRSAQTCIDQCFKRWKRRSPSSVLLLDLTITAQYFCYLACAENPRNGTRVFGVAASRDPEAAVTAAARELIQMEMGLAIIFHRQRHGQKLASTEHRILQRAQGLRTVGSVLFVGQEQLSFQSLPSDFKFDTHVSILQDRAPSVAAVVLSTPADAHELSRCTAPWGRWSPYY